MKNIFITGINGFVGKHLAERFSGESNYRLTGVDLADSFTPLNEQPANLNYLRVDITKSDEVAAVFDKQQFDVIFHLAGILSKDESFQVHERAMNVNFKSTSILLEIARQQQARFLFTSTAMVYGNRSGPFTEDMDKDPGNFYALTKSLSEELILYFSKKFDVKSAIFRPAMLYGPGQAGDFFVPTLINALSKNEEFEMTAGEQKRDFVYIDDFINAIKLTIEKEATGIFNIGSGNGQQIKEVAKTVELKLGVKDKLQLGALPYRDHEIWDYSLSSDKLLKETGWRPTVSIEQGIDLILKDRREKERKNEN